MQRYLNREAERTQVLREERHSRTELILGNTGIERLRNSRIAVFGIGGVGGYVVEGLVRSGIGSIDLIDNDEVCPSNLNRQIIALDTTMGMDKCEAMRNRIMDIDPSIRVKTHKCFFLPENAGDFDFKDYDYVVDAVDTMTAKIGLVMKCIEVNTPVICALGAGNKLDPSKLMIADIYETKVDPLARIMRHEMKRRGVKHLKCAYSTETPIETGGEDDTTLNKRRSTPGSAVFVPGAMGLLIASEVVRDITEVRI